MIYIGIDNGNACQQNYFVAHFGMDKNKAREAQRRYILRTKGIDVPFLKRGPESQKGCQKTDFLCDQCRKIFTRPKRSESDPKKSERNFCSSKCYSIFKKGETNPNYKGNRKCRGCGTHVMGAQRVFCSKDCKNKHHAKCEKERYPQNRLNRNMRRSVTRFLSSGIKAKRSWKSLVGYNSEELMNHLESKFTSEMSWDNYGSYWHVDHIRPVASFKFEKPEDLDFQTCWSLSNLQPLSAKENLKKNSKYNGSRIYRCR